MAGDMGAIRFEEIHSVVGKGIEGSDMEYGSALKAMLGSFHRNSQ